MPRRDFKWNAFEKLRMKPGSFSARAKRSEVLTVRHARRFVLSRWENTQLIRQHMAFWLTGMGLLIASVAVQYAWFNGEYTTKAAVEGGTYIEGTVGEVKTLNPLYTSTASEESVARLAFSSLFTYDETGNLKNDVATRITTTDDGKTYTVALRHDVTWQDGKPLTADDVLFTLNLIKNPDTHAALYNGWKDVDVKKVDQYTLKFTLSSEYAPFPYALMFSILPQHTMSKITPEHMRESTADEKLVGSGPFSIQSTQNTAGDRPHKVVRFERNTRYYRGLPKIERMQIYAYVDQDTLIDSVANGDVNAATGVGVSQTAKIDKSNYQVSANPLAAGVYALFNNSQPQLKDEKVRRALQIGTDINELLKQYPVHLNRLDTPMTGYQVNVSDIKKPQYDKKKAEKLLDDSGWKLSKDNLRHKAKDTLTLNIVTIKDADYQIAVDTLAKQWRELGIDVRVRTIDTHDPSQNIASTVLQPRDYDVLVYELFLGADPDGYAYWHSSQTSARGLNLTNYKDPVSDDILVSARARTEPKLREAKYRAFAKRWIEQAPAIGLYQSDNIYIHKSNVNSFDGSTRFVTAADRFNNVQHWTVRQDSVYKTP